MVLNIEKESLAKEGHKIAGSHYRQLLDDFIKSIPEDGPLWKREELKNLSMRAISFGEMYNNLRIILRGYGNLVDQGEKEAILARMRIIKKEAAFWTPYAKERNFEKEIDATLQEIVPLRDREKFGLVSRSARRYH